MFLSSIINFLASLRKPDKLIALSFDDGPSLITTPKVLDVLKGYNVPASFFVVGNYIDDNSAEMMKRAVEQGCDIENHSFSHRVMKRLAEYQIVKEVETTSSIIESYVGRTPKFFRPLFLAFNQRMLDCIDLTFICGRSCEDWEPKVSAWERAKLMFRQAEDGQIVLLHDYDGNDKTVKALKLVIPLLKAKGYKFVTVEQLFKEKNVEINPDRNEIYWNVLKH